jgi:uncharacterized protein (TIGR01777 family)
MQVLISGASGLVGSALSQALQADGHVVHRLVRQRSAGEREVFWNQEAGSIDSKDVSGFDAVVHLAGENIASGRWTSARMERIRSSRVDGTQVLSDALAKAPSPPRVFVCASAIGIYGDRGEEALDEESSVGSGFLPDVCAAWERATDAASRAGIRVACLRIGVVLSGKGGALAKMLIPFKLCVGGKIGDGRQFMSWIALDDLVGAIRHVIDSDTTRGAVNVVSPTPVTNLQFTKSLGRVLSRPTIAPMPAFAAKLVLGKMAQDLLLASARVVPRKLSESGYRFAHPDLEGALRHVLGK